MTKVIVTMGASLTLAGSAGFLTSMAIGASNPPAPVKTVTITLKNGTPGPIGPKGDTGPVGPKGDTGPQGPSGAVSCPNGFVPGDVVINHPGGQVTIYGCIK
jgi:hypothetical protein